VKQPLFRHPTKKTTYFTVPMGVAQPDREPRGTSPRQLRLVTNRRKGTKTKKNQGKKKEQKKKPKKNHTKPQKTKKTKEQENG